MSDSELYPSPRHTRLSAVLLAQSRPYTTGRLTKPYPGRPVILCRSFLLNWQPLPGYPQNSMLDVRCSMFIISVPSTPPSRLIPRSPFPPPSHLPIFSTSFFPTFRLPTSAFSPMPHALCSPSHLLIFFLSRIPYHPHLNQIWFKNHIWFFLRFLFQPLLQSSISIFIIFSYS